MGNLGGIRLEVGDVLAKKYRLERLVGQGGTGVVVAATHVQLEQRVAIKFLRPKLATDEIRRRFEREARAITKIQSEHVVLVLDVGTLPDGGDPYMVMEYLEGRDLARVLKEDGNLSVEDAVDCMLQVCEALAAAHAAGIVHRDLKPANLFLTRREDGGPHIKVVDFGISKIFDKEIVGEGAIETTGAYDVLGSPRYMAPEQLRASKNVDRRADLWSVGAVLYQLVTGRYPFDADTNVQASAKVMSGEPDPLRKHAPHAPPALEAIVKKCLVKDVAGRYQSARELADALSPLASDPTKDSLERMHEAKVAPSLSIALDVTSIVPPSSSDLTSKVPPSRGVAPTPGGVARAESAASKAGSARRPEPRPRSQVPRLSPRLSPRHVKLAIAAGGLLAVLLTFALLSAAKVAFRSAGASSGDSVGPLADVPAVTYVPPRPDPVTIPLDAGRKRP